MAAVPSALTSSLAARGEDLQGHVYLLHYKPRLVLTSRPPERNADETQRFFPKAAKYGGERIPLISELLERAWGELLNDRQDVDASRATSTTLTGEQHCRAIHPVGRLDLDSEGLIFLTDDARFSTTVTSPAHGHSKVYRVLAKSRAPAFSFSSPSNEGRGGGGEEAECERTERATCSSRAKAEMEALFARPPPPIADALGTGNVNGQSSSIRLLDSELVAANVFQRRIGIAKAKEGGVEDADPDGDNDRDSAPEEKKFATSKRRKVANTTRSTSGTAAGPEHRGCPTRLHVVLVEVTLHSGKKHEVRRLMRALGFQVLTLQRVELCGLRQTLAATCELASVRTGLDTLEDLGRPREESDSLFVVPAGAGATAAMAPGQFRFLEEEEVGKIMQRGS